MAHPIPLLVLVRGGGSSSGQTPSNTLVCMESGFMAAMISRWEIQVLAAAHTMATMLHTQQ